MTLPTDPTRATTDRQQEPRDTDESSLARVVEAAIGRPVDCLLAEMLDVANWIERTKPQGLLYDSARPALLEARTALLSLLSLLSPEGGGIAAPAWQPIESAPEDEAVLIWRPSDTRDDNIFVATRSVDRWECEDGKNYYGLRGTYPTHWMPLPPSPQAEGEGK